MDKKALDEKYSYQIDEHYVVHLFHGEDDCQQYLTNPLLSAIFKIETLEKENTELKKELGEKVQHLDLTEREWAKDMSKMIHYKTQVSKAKEIIGELFHYIPSWTGKENDKPRVYAMPDELRAKAEQFLNSEVEK